MSVSKNTETLPQLATKIHSLERKTISSTIEIGRLLQVAFDGFEHGDRAEYHAWVENEFAWSERTARRYRELYEFQNGHSVQFEKLNITITALYFLAEIAKFNDDTTPDLLPGIAEVIRRAKMKERITSSRASEIFSAYGDARAAERAEAKLTELVAAHIEPEPEPEPELDPIAELPEPNELSRAMEVIRDHGGMYAKLWAPTAKLINAQDFRTIIETLQAVATKYHGAGGDDALKSKADRAEARSRSAKVLPFVAPEPAMAL